MCCKNTLIQHIIRQIGSNSACGTNLCDVIDALWELVCHDAAGDCRLQALLTKREAVLYLLGCESYAVDQSEAHFTMSATTTADTKNDYNSQSQATTSRNRFGRGQGNTKYDEISNSKSVYDSKRTGRAEDKSDGDSKYRDDGRGYGFNRNQSFTAIDNSVNHQGESFSDQEGLEIGRRRDCNYEYSQNNTEGNVFTILVAGASYSGSTSEWRKYSNTTAENQDTLVGNSFREATENDTGLHTGRGVHRWENTFLADIEWYEQEYIIRFHNERFDRRRTADSHAEGTGDGVYEERARGYNAEQGTALATGFGTSDRLSVKVSDHNDFSISHSQRFGTLLTVYDQLTEQIHMIYKRLRANSPPGIVTLSCNCQGTCCCGPGLRERGYAVAMRASGCSTCSSRLQRSGAF